MTTRATGTFTIDSWEPRLYDEAEGATLTRTRVTKTFRGEIEGTSTAELLMASAGEGSMAYVGFERIAVSIIGHAGTFVLHHNAIASRDGQTATWTVLPHSGTGALQGLRGAAQIVSEPDGGHTFILDYDLD
ncbi:MAG TPA: DUF3224 domain-containing protein [Ktedonobacterales bacterium]|nr:DUF3224 domain-containing protein [Ktedonobacterales bacterium]